MGLQKAERRAQRCVKPRDQRIASVLDIELETVREQHGRASDRSAVFLRKAQSRVLEQEDAAGSPFGLARQPESVFVEANEKERDRLAQCASIRPTGKFRRGNRRERRLIFPATPAAFDDKTNAAQKRAVNFDMGSVPRHDRGRDWAAVPPGGSSPGMTLTDVSPLIRFADTECALGRI
jgi:hypothetical protein